ncbi:MAG TPA: alpha/beta fold hydrolase [Longimicrobiales bacterium]
MQHAINGVTLHWRDAGAGEPVVFIHGFPFRSTMWAPQFEAIPAGWRFLAPDLRGFGASERGSALMSIDLFADDIVALLDHLEIEQAVICGMSMGGYVAFSLVSRYPHRVRGVVLVATRASADSEEGIKARFELAMRVRNSGVDVVVQSMLPKVLAGNTTIQHPEVVEFVRNMMATTAPETVAGALIAMAHRQDYRDMLHRIDVSAMIVRGDQDQIIAREEMDLLTRMVRGAKYEVVPNVGHMPNLEAPDVFNTLLFNFLNFLPPAVRIGDLTLNF